MKKIIYIILLFLFFSGTFVAGSRYGQRGMVLPDASRDRRILYYVDPMNPIRTSDKPGIAPCGMPMEPVYEDESAVAGGADAALPPDSIRIVPEKQQLMGVRIARVDGVSGAMEIRVPARVAPDENSVYRIKAGVDGWVHEVSALTTGSQVEKDQFLFSFATNDLFTSAQALILALMAMDRLHSAGMEIPAEYSPTTSNFLQRIERLQSLGMSSAQIDEMKQARDIPHSIKSFSPAAGFVLARTVSPEERFDKGAELYRIADLRKVWILAEIPEYQADHITPGMKARVNVPHRKQTLEATVSDILPLFDPANRIFKVRLEVDNPGFVLRPDMIVYTDFALELPRSVMVPEDAILLSGLKKTLFVDLGDGVFQARQVKTGTRFGDKVQILDGLEPGERIVLSGNFLIDSESRMKKAAAMRLEKEQPPRAEVGKGIDVSPARHAETAVGIGKTALKGLP
ncbi:MAG: efflux RND transporter periplasmic adaptor subunit [Syntrophobacteraceae bacterium]